jgi:hypothetical protein
MAKSLSNLAMLSWNADNSASLVTVLWPRVFCYQLPLLLDDPAAGIDVALRTGKPLSVGHERP